MIQNNQNFLASYKEKTQSYGFCFPKIRKSNLFSVKTRKIVTSVAKVLQCNRTSTFIFVISMGKKVNPICELTFLRQIDFTQNAITIQKKINIQFDMLAANNRLSAGLKNIVTEVLIARLASFRSNCLEQNSNSKDFGSYP